MTTPASTRLSRRWAIIAALTFVTFTALAYCSLFFGATRNVGDVEKLYRSIGLFTGNSSWAFPDAGKPMPPQLFQFLAVIAPLITALGVTQLVRGWLGQWLIRLTTRLCLYVKSGHFVAVFGLNQESLAFARRLKQDPRATYHIRLFDPEPDANLAAQCEVEGFALYGRPLAGRLRGVANIVSFLPSLDDQIKLLNHLKNVLPKFEALPPNNRSKEHPRATFLVHDRELGEKLADHIKFNGILQSFYPYLINYDDLAARTLLAKHPLDMIADALGQHQIHIAVLGCGALGRAVIKAAIRLYVTRVTVAGTKIRVSILDQHADHVYEELLAEVAAIDQVADISAVVLRVPAAGLTEAQVKFRLPDRVTAFVVAIGDVRASYSIALSLRRWLLEPPVLKDEDWRRTHPLAPVFVRISSWEGLGHLIKSGVDHELSGPAEAPDGIFGCGAAEELITPDALFNRKREAAARVHHLTYGQVFKAVKEIDKEQRAAEGLWQALPPAVRDSNYEVIDHLPVKARSVGYRIERLPGRKTEPSNRRFTKEEQEFLAELEHCRYLNERFSSGWHFAPSRCDAVLAHPDLVPWKQLVESEKNIDRNLTSPAKLDAYAWFLECRFAKTLNVAIAPGLADDEKTKHLLKAKLRKLCADNPDRALVILTTLQPGLPLLAAEAAEELARDERLPLAIPVCAYLPLPYELFEQDFSKHKASATTSKPHIDRLKIAAGCADYYIEMPLFFGCASEMSESAQTEADNKLRRARQYERASAYLYRSAHEVLALKREDVPRSAEEYPMPTAFFPPPPAVNVTALTD